MIAKKDNARANFSKASDDAWEAFLEAWDRWICKEVMDAVPSEAMNVYLQWLGDGHAVAQILLICREESNSFSTLVRSFRRDEYGLEMTFPKRCDCIIEFRKGIRDWLRDDMQTGAAPMEVINKFNEAAYHGDEMATPLCAGRELKQYFSKNSEVLHQCLNSNAPSVKNNCC